MLRNTLILMLFVLAASGCSLQPSVPVTRLDLHLTGSEKLNPDLQGRPSPIVLRLYELKNPVTFEHAEFFPLYQQSQDTLALDLVAQEELELRPGEKQQLRLLTTPKGGYLGVLAAYRNLPEAEWRAVIPLRVGELNRVQLLLDELSVHVQNPAAQARN